MPHAYTEDQLVEQTAIGLFVGLGWTSVSASKEIRVNYVIKAWMVVVGSS